jgi:hypothetical protein
MLIKVHAAGLMTGDTMMASGNLSFVTKTQYAIAYSLSSLMDMNELIVFSFSHNQIPGKARHRMLRDCGFDRLCSQ